MSEKRIKIKGIIKYNKVSKNEYYIRTCVGRGRGHHVTTYRMKMANNGPAVPARTRPTEEVMMKGLYCRM